MAQRVIRRFIGPALKVDIEDVLPRAAARGPGFNLAEADVTQGKYAQCLEKSSRNVAHLERDGGLVSSGKNTGLFADQEKTGEVAFVIFNARAQNHRAIDAGSLAAGDSPGLGQPFFNHMLDGSGCVVERHRLDMRVDAKKIPALIESDRV